MYLSAVPRVVFTHAPDNSSHVVRIGPLWFSVAATGRHSIPSQPTFTLQPRVTKRELSSVQLQWDPPTVLDAYQVPLQYLVSIEDVSDAHSPLNRSPAAANRSDADPVVSSPGSTREYIERVFASDHWFTLEEFHKMGLVPGESFSVSVSIRKLSLKSPGTVTACIPACAVGIAQAHVPSSS